MKMTTIYDIKVRESPVTVKDAYSNLWKTVPVFHITLVTNGATISVRRYIPDCQNLDKLIKSHYPKVRVGLPSMTESASKRLGFFSFFRIYSKSNSKKLKKYLYQCSSDPILKSSTLLRDFLSPQREGDFIDGHHINRSKAPNTSSDQLVPTSCSIPDNLNPEPEISREPKSKSSNFLNASITSSCNSQSLISKTYSVKEIDDNEKVIENIKKTVHATPVGISEYPMTHRVTFSLAQFDFLKVLGKGCMGKVTLVSAKKSSRLYALKSIVKEHVIEQREIVHTMDEKNILARISKINHPYLAKLYLSFQDEHRLYLLTNYYCGGDLATQMAKVYSFAPETVRFYAAEIIEGLGELHRLGILYRDLKPENILLTNDGHIVLTDFGLCKSLNESNNAVTFCGTAEYLAPEILMGELYSFGVDHWSLGTIIYELLAGIPPFWDDNHDVMYQRILQDPLYFPTDIFDYETTQFLTEILDRDPRTRLGVGGIDEIKNHIYFAGISWEDIRNRQENPPGTPHVTSQMDFSNFDAEFIAMSPNLTPLSSEIDFADETQDAFDGYSFVDENFYEEQPSYCDIDTSNLENGSMFSDVQEDEDFHYKERYDTTIQENRNSKLREPLTLDSNIIQYNNDTTSSMSITAFDYLEFLQSPNLRLSFHMDQEQHVIKENSITPVSVQSSITDMSSNKRRDYLPA